jgi:lysyl-tRNA synthetase class 2
MDIEQHHYRSKIFAAIRAFFDERRYIEVETPLLSPDLIPESCLEVFKTTRLFPAGGKAKAGRDLYLIPSPEIHMKKIIAAYPRDIYQICKCFRNGESEGRLHASEFTMLEYYTMRSGCLDSLALTEQLVAALGRALPGLGLPAPAALLPPFARMTVGEAFIMYAGFDLYEAVETDALADEARKRGIAAPEGAGVQVLYDLLFVQEVEPNLPQDKPLVLTDYPAFVPALAQLHDGGKTRRRWELYMRGVELANCYAEETDAAAVKAFFEGEARAKRARAVVRHKVDRDYWKLFLPKEDGRRFPECSGVAMGLDRLVMLLTGRNAI